MRFEAENFHLIGLNLDQIRIDRVLLGTGLGESLPLSPAQLQTLEFFAQGMSLRQTVLTFFRNGVFPSFAEIRDLISFIVEQDLIRGRETLRAFREKEISAPSLWQSAMDLLFGEKLPPLKLREELRRFPFFRSLPHEIFELFLRHGKVLRANEGIRLCRQGERKRSLFVLLEGAAAVFRVQAGTRKRVGELNPGCLFGETGFFLGEPRTADIDITETSLLFRLDYRIDPFDRLIRRDKAKALQERFLLIHALLKSPVFRDLAPDCFDALIFSGQTRTFAAHQQIFKQGDPGASCFLLLRGEVEVVQNGQILRQLEQGDCFGELALIMTGGLRTASIRTKSEVLTVEITSENFYRLLAENFFLACEFENIARERWGADLKRRRA